MKAKLLLIVLLASFASFGSKAASWSGDSLNSPLSPLNYTIDQIVLDIYNAVTELGETDYEQLQSDLYAIHETPIDLNHTSDEELSQLAFLSPRQIDDLLMYADQHPFVSLYELRLIPSLADFDIRNLLPFVTITNHTSPFINHTSQFINPKSEFLARTDARNIEGYSGTDPMYVQARYRLDFSRRIVFGAQLRRPEGGDARDLKYGAYVRLRDIGHLHTLVAGNFQASFGQGLVFAPVFHFGKSAYVSSVAQTTEGLRYYSSVDGEGLHGAGATFRWNWGKATRLDVTALYSLKRTNDSIWQHIIGANLTFRHKQLQVQLTAAEKIWSDSIHPYRDTEYNRHYFRGRNQAVLGASVRYNHGWFDFFAELATAENHQSSIINHQLREAHWGLATLIGARIYPTDGVSLIALHRYYSPFFDNDLGYAFSETSRIGDENGTYLAFDITRLRQWRFSGYIDLFLFSEPKYGIPQSPSLGHDLMAEIRYINHKSQIINHQWHLDFRVRLRKRGTSSTFSARAVFDWTRDAWSLRTTAEANLIPVTRIPSSVTAKYGLTVYQDIAYNFQLSPFNYRPPLSLHLRLQGFDAREWDNRIYTCEHDVLYAFSTPAVYGIGGKAYVCLKWQIIKQLALYAKVSETVYQTAWAEEYNRAVTRTDIHFLLRAKF